MEQPATNLQKKIIKTLATLRQHRILFSGILFTKDAYWKGQTLQEHRTNLEQSGTTY